MKERIFVAFLMLANITLGMYGWHGYHARVWAQGKAPVAEPAPPIRPSDEFLADVDTYVKLVVDVQTIQKKLKATKEWKAYQDANDRALGMQLRITQQIPRGYTWDPKSRLLVPAPAAPLLAPVQVPPTPAPAPVKP